jgi:hypothetical protein
VLAGAQTAGAVSSTIPISIAAAMTVSTSTIEVEFPVTVTCDDIGAIDSYVYVHLQQDKTGASGSGEVRPLICDSNPHLYLVHVFADALVFHDGAATASSVAQNIGQNLLEQSGSASAPTTLVFGKVDDPATSVTSSTSGSTYNVTIEKKGSLFGKEIIGDGYGIAHINVTVTCTPPTTSYSPWLTVDVEAPNGQGVITGSNAFNNPPDPQLVCDGTAHTYEFTVFAQLNTGPPGGFTSGRASAAAYIEASYGSPQWPTAPNADAVATVQLG